MCRGRGGEKEKERERGGGIRLLWMTMAKMQVMLCDTF